MQFHEILRQLRKEKKLTQVQVAKGAHISNRQYQCLEYGTHMPMLENLISLADFLDISLDELVGREYPKPPTNKI